ncbi:MAG: DUF3696 domain-containing protein [Ruminococcus sp.]|nr:DUF3696 domain-containing protein [Ruminococcus sp.]
MDVGNCTGDIDFWPEGFLDEWNHVLMELL